MTAVTMSACGGGGGSPAPPTFTVSGLGAAGATNVTLSAATTYGLSATETASGGRSVTPGPLTITLDNVAIGTVSGDSLVTGVVNATGHVKVADSSTGLSVTFTVSVLSTHPATAGDTVTLSGTLSHTVARPQPAPSAIASPVTTTATVTDVLKVASTSATFGATTNAIDENVVETDVSPLATLTTTSDTYEIFVPSGSLQLFTDVGTTAFDSNGSGYATTPGAGAGIIDELPDANGATWSNTAALLSSETDADGTTIVRTTAANGTYSETDAYLGQASLTSVTQTNADLSAGISALGGLPIAVAFAAPSGGSIAYTITPAPAFQIAPITGTVADWFPTSTIYSDTSTKSTNQTIPAACSASATVGTTATKIVDATTHLDTALGTYEQRSETTYDVPGYGTACVQLSDVIDSYYDYTGQSPQTILPGLNIALSASPLQIDTISETLGFTSGTVANAAARRSARSVSPEIALHAVAPMFERAIDAVYRSRRARLAKELGR
jgi:hypothetical protein